MDIWLVDFGTGTKREYFDLSESTGSYLELKPGFIKNLQVYIHEYKNYEEKIGVIKSAEDPQGKPVSTPFCLLIISKTGLTVSFLGRFGAVDSSFLLGYWPEQFISILKSHSNAVLTLLYAITEKPETILKLELLS